MQGTNATVYEVTDFQRDVLEASYRMPVLVDFWAPWCGPCQILGPVLERLAQKYAGKWKLVKVNTDEHPELAMQYGVRGIPAVKLFVNGEVVGEFVGALPEYAIEQWLAEVLPDENRAQLEQIEQLLDEGKLAEAEPLLRKLLAADPGNDKARVLLARIRVFDDPDEAERLLENLDIAEAAYLQQIEGIRTIARLLRLKDQPESLPEGPGRDFYRQAIEALARKDFDTAVERLIDVLRKDRYYDDDGARKAGVAIFTLLGARHPVTQRWRRTFDMWLY
ncbi:thioredoxin [Rhodothermus marinus]|uniref:thioredoxin n=1 Tax=Rhodothermus marinus TaxID=29549 RepID=UPI0012BA43C8|nr:thioredoxin [Rhodothermus marinus]BBM72223.1 thioredoxin [Rhodothermus marinus]